MIKENNLRLDYELNFSFPMSDFISPILSHGEPVPVNLYLRDEEAWIDLFIKSPVNAKDIPLVESLTPIYLDSVTAVSERVGVSGFLDLYRSLVSIPSVVPGGFYILDKRAHVSLRFYSGDRGAVYSIMHSAIVKLEGILIEYMGPSRGIISTLNAINNRIPLSIVKYTFQSSSSPLVSNDSSFVVEYRLMPQKYNKHGHIIYSSSLKKNKYVYPISEENGIFAVKSVSNETDSLLGLISSDRIAIGAFFEECSKDKNTVLAVLPQLLLNAFMIRLQAVFSNLSNSTLDVILMEPYSENEISVL
ncbi:MAG: hypothetical protein QXM60_05615 [Thermoplasmatales archaeon]